jgi:hypothetical protein
MTTNQHKLASALLGEQLAHAALQRAVEMHEQAMFALAESLEPMPGVEPSAEHIQFAAQCRAFGSALLDASIAAPDCGSAMHLLDNLVRQAVPA